MKWLDVVKKHLKLNPGKSLKDVMPAVKKEYYAIVGKVNKSKKINHSKKSHKRKSHKRKSHKKKSHKKK